ITDLVLLTGYSLMVGFDALPENDYGKLALTVFATGTWVDFSKDIISPFGSNDLVKIHNLYGRTSEWQRLPYRLLHLGVSAAAAYFVVRGYQEVFEDDDPAPAPRVMVGLWGGSF